VVALEALQFHTATLSHSREGKINIGE